MGNRVNKVKKYYSFTIFGSVMLLSGVGLAIFSLHVVYKNLHPMLFWEKTSGKIIDTIQEYDNDGEFYVFEKASYIDKAGNQFEVVSKTSAGTTEANLPSKGEVTVYYNPENSKDAIITMWRNFLPVIMFPFGLLLIFFGWPWVEKME